MLTSFPDPFTIAFFFIEIVSGTFRLLDTEGNRIRSFWPKRPSTLTSIQCVGTKCLSRRVGAVLRLDKQVEYAVDIETNPNNPQYYRDSLVLSGQRF
jgi:hypothetical protein